MKVETMEIGKKWVKIKLGDWQCMHVCVYVGIDIVQSSVYDQTV